MCGIAGMFSLTGRPLNRPELVRAMTARLVHRGPDEDGYFVNRSRTISLGHRRLRIIDLETGRQPLSNEDGSVTVVFNGEIYGFHSLRDRLIARGHRFATKTDTEVIVHLYEEEGTGCLRHIKGMFAFALWDDSNQRLFLARDRLGKKPLYYATHQGLLVVASEFSALLGMPGISRDLDVLALDAYLTLEYIPAPRTIFRQVKKLEAGHYLIVENGELRKERYWIPNGEAPDVTAPEDKKEELIKRIREATALRMVSDVPLGCFLSGGVDSSTVLSFMAELSAEPVQTFTIGFPETEYSELDHARRIARHFGTDHHEYVLEPDGVEVLDDIVRHLGEPFADATALPTWYLAKLSKKSVTVALTGDGGDELFGGYGWYRTARYLEMAGALPSWLVRGATAVAAIGGRRAHDRAGKIRALLTRSSAGRYAALRQILPPKLKESLYTPEFARQSSEEAIHWLERQYESLNIQDALSGMMATDLITYLSEDLLVKLDRMSMAHSLECRSPLLDSDLVEWVSGLPSTDKLGWLEGKRLLREAVRERFPRGFLDRPKQGFNVPLARWFRMDLQKVVVDRVLQGPLIQLGLLRPEGLRALVTAHFDGKANHEQALWSLLVLATWTEKFHV